MPRLMPNENAVLYGKETLSDASRQKEQFLWDSSFLV